MSSDCLVDLVNARGWRSDNGTFRLGYLAQLVRMLGERMVSCSLTTTVIESRIKLLKKTFQAIEEMRGPTGSGFGWNDNVKCIITERVHHHREGRVRSLGPVKGLLNKPFPHCEALSYVFEKDRATGVRVETFADIGSNVSADNDNVPVEDGINMEFPTMCSQRMKCPMRT
ncbi:retrotransposon protein [Cucumis melo var. makuwa]|uniref:Retrotransposon protein n=1 Tax=Cucumis melo var. makuwa TaxID=1194695 RepID=A0A5A7SXR1_CUCMM|nr:retrotransposon protein [Cucumis melo var. makuwa]TYK27595.1 retrotransposon protein [Cucumis melo var. makuwa]